MHQLAVSAETAVHREALLRKQLDAQAHALRALNASATPATQGTTSTTRWESHRFCFFLVLQYVRIEKHSKRFVRLRVQNTWIKKRHGARPRRSRAR